MCGPFIRTIFRVAFFDRLHDTYVCLSSAIAGLRVRVQLVLTSCRET